MDNDYIGYNGDIMNINDIFIQLNIMHMDNLMDINPLW